MNYSSNLVPENIGMRQKKQQQQTILADLNVYTILISTKIKCAFIIHFNILIFVACSHFE